MSDPTNPSDKPVPPSDPFVPRLSSFPGGSADPSSGSGNSGAQGTGGSPSPEPVPACVPAQEKVDPRHQAAERAREFGKQAYDQAREATENARDVVRQLFADPIGVQEKALEALGSGKAMSAGAVFSVLFIFVNLLAGMGGFRGVSLGGVSYRPGFLVALVCPLFFAAGLCGAVYLIGKIWGRDANVSHSIFTSGVALLPLAMAAIPSFVAVKWGVVFAAVAFCLFGLAMAVVLVNA